jgi:NAD(P)-dependent dehydrogenase (short-subunit alcohol dehydrogenase family)
VTDDAPRIAVVTGGSRGIGAATARALAMNGYDVAITFRNKAARAQAVTAEIEETGRRGLALRSDMTNAEDVARLASEVRRWEPGVDVLVLNASGGLERELVEADPAYPWRINRDGQIATVNALLPLMRRGGAVVFVTSHWAHLYGEVAQFPAYEPIAQSKRAGEDALRARQGELAERGVRLIVLTGDLVDGTITPKLLDRAGPGVLDGRKAAVGVLPTAEEMGAAIAAAVANVSLASGSTVVVGGGLEALKASSQL